MRTDNPYRRVAGGTPAPVPSFKKAQAPLKANPNSRTASAMAGADGEFNPAGFGGWRSAVREAVPSGSRMFDKKGSINAQDKKDALTQIAHLLQNMTKSAGMRDFSRTAEEKEAKAERMKVLAAAMNDPSGEGFAIVGQELLLPIKSIIDYEGWARKIFRVRPLAQGELFRLAKDVRSTAFVIGQDGQGIESRLYGKYITPSEFKITSFPTVDIEEIYQMNYDVLDRAQDTARQEIELNEDKRALALIDRASQAINTTTIFGTLGIGAFEDTRYQVERHRLSVEKFLIARAELSDIVKTMSTVVDPVTERELLLAGYIGNVLNANIITTAGTGVEEVVPAGVMYAVTASGYLGEMGIRIELFSEPFNQYSERRLVKGWAFGELLGFAIPEARSCAKASK
jgi:hypothetical protein